MQLLLCLAFCMLCLSRLLCDHWVKQMVSLVLVIVILLLQVLIDTSVGIFLAVPCVLVVLFSPCCVWTSSDTADDDGVGAIVAETGALGDVAEDSAAGSAVGVGVPVDAVYVPLLCGHAEADNGFDT